jgi:hypothetical protein
VVAARLPAKRSNGADLACERNETERLRPKVDRLEREIVDNQIALLTSNEGIWWKSTFTA